ncbi:formylglycine-generating enzyme family protein [Thermaurantiacus tibetensis]|uniref:formylglycine-generating enzyme family protein n=1 Tax=Thermaurantiacus tibetensis TaxID=2759035 RepID=UPI00188EC680|nr:formylglycine-generating enzyme family protein [Thermaurantiacus tibetensis]
MIVRIRPIAAVLAGLVFVSVAAPAASAGASAASAAVRALRFRDCAECPELVRIPPGRFRMGHDGGELGRPEGPAHEVVVARAFALATTETSVRQFAAFVEATGHEPTAGCEVWPQGSFPREAANWRRPGPDPSSLDHPVACVSWNDAVAYVRWLSERTGRLYRLPSEAEWEYAARAGTTAAYPWGDRAEDGCRFANLYDLSAAGRFSWPHAACDDGHPGPAPVGSYPANAFGLHDMIGNVWEWTADCYVAPYPVPATGARAAAVVEAPAGEPCTRRSVRGGSWMTRPDRNRTSFRGRDPADTRFFMFGFRVARDLLPDEMAPAGPSRTAP